MRSLTIVANDLIYTDHKAGEEKRSLVIIPRAEYDDWLSCRDPERARTYLQPFPAEMMAAAPAPKPKNTKEKVKSVPDEPGTSSLF
ncbi:MAG TPA: hypothetical protein VIE65_03195 [Methylobacter sp.]|jgi:putative SOS response-associated peptidase YedK